ncbi:MAG: family 10 glycosylhydrolase [Candidatus Caldatribacteriaceae bacterium]
MSVLLLKPSFTKTRYPRWILCLLSIAGTAFLWTNIALSFPQILGVWVDVKSIPVNREEIGKIVERLKEAHFNAIFLESFYNGQTIYPSPFLASLGLPAQMETFAQEGIDPLKIFLEEAHRRGVAVHAWIHFFYVSRNEPGAILSRFPHWAVVSREGKAGYQSGTNFLFWLCPLEEEVEAFYQKLLKELANRYDLDGIQFDYFRFPEPTLADTCYAEKHRRKFLEEYGVDPITINPRRDGEFAERWIRFRSDGLTDFARNLTRTLREKYPHLRLSCAVKPLGFPLKRYPGSLQDWPRWAEEGLFDFLVPMTYSSRPAEFEGMLLWAKTFAPQIPLLSGVWTVNLTTSTILEEIERAQQYPLEGLVLFAYPYLTDETLRALSRLEPQEKEKRAIPPLSFYRENARTIKALFTREPITVDGKLQEKTWQAIPFESSFSLLTGGPSEKKSEVAVRYDEKNLYLAFRLQQFPQREDRFTKRDEPVFYEDSLEVYLDPSGNEGIFYQLAVNEAQGLYDSSSLTGPSWNGNWKVGIARDGDTLTAEVAIAFADLEVERPEKGDTWGINFYRNEPQEGMFCAFSPVPGVYAAPTLLGKLQFEN